MRVRILRGTKVDGKPDRLMLDLPFSDGDDKAFGTLVRDFGYHYGRDAGTMRVMHVEIPIEPQNKETAT